MNTTPLLTPVVCLEQEAKQPLSFSERCRRPGHRPIPWDPAVETGSLEMSPDGTVATIKLHPWKAASAWSVYFNNVLQPVYCTEEMKNDKITFVICPDSDVATISARGPHCVYRLLKPFPGTYETTVKLMTSLLAPLLQTPEQWRYGEEGFFCDSLWFWQIPLKDVDGRLASLLKQNILTTMENLDPMFAGCTVTLRTFISPCVSGSVLDYVYVKTTQPSEAKRVSSCAAQ